MSKTRLQILRGTTTQRTSFVPRDGELVWDTDLETLFVGDGNTAGGIAPMNGADGIDGEDGKTILNGSGAPSNSLGVDGDFYIDTASLEIYGPKSGTWGASQSIVGPQGIKGDIGPAGPMNVEFYRAEPVIVTLPNSTTFQTIYTDTFNVSAAGNCFLDISLAVRPHSTGNDMLFLVRMDNVIIQPEYDEEHKDVSAAQSMWRSQCFDLPNFAAGSHTLELLFAKEVAGGTAQLKNYVAKLVRFS